jgi:hypothetical protein
VTFKELRRIIEENQKLDDDKIAMMRLRLWPAGSGNGHNNNNNAWGLGWKGRPIISSEEWKRLAGYKELDDVLTSDEKMQCKMALDVPEDVLPKEVWDRVNAQMIKEINPKVLQYFPQPILPYDVVTVVFDPSYSCPKASDVYKLWVSDYRELLIARGLRDLIPGFSYGS